MDDWEAQNERTERLLAKLAQESTRLQEECSSLAAEQSKSPEAKQWLAATKRSRERKADPPLWRDIT